LRIGIFLHSIFAPYFTGWNAVQAGEKRSSFSDLLADALRDRKPERDGRQHNAASDEQVQIEGLMSASPALSLQVRKRFDTERISACRIGSDSPTLLSALAFYD
jgi:hypothetical protein